ncbi:MAG: aldehyde dehydrogenase family protein, partial [Clostridia bacterium]|nr:aldehyde dehydrogenase family protein [Clostridia bacterium]
MQEQQIIELLTAQKRFFRSGATLPVAYRIEALKKLKAAIRAKEEKIAEALKTDLGKGRMEGFMCEIGLVQDEITYMLRHVRRYAAEHTVKTPLTQFASRSYKKPTPRGNVLIMSPWNYPFLLTIDPLVDAIAAGNTAVIKPSAYSPAVSEVIRELLTECFSPEYVAVVKGGREEKACLLNHPFYFI